VNANPLTYSLFKHCAPCVLASSRSGLHSWKTQRSIGCITTCAGSALPVMTWRAAGPCYFATGADRGVRLSDVARASASIPLLLPPIHVESPNDHTTMLLTDGGVSDCLPVAFAKQPPLGATHLIVSDCRWFAARRPLSSGCIVYVRPRLPSTGTLWAPAFTLASAVCDGRSAVTKEMLHTIYGWARCFAT
jgi:hypothetical protein